MPITGLYHRLQAVHPELPKYLVAIALMAVCSGVFENTYNNFLYAQFDIKGDVRGYLELIREFPGLMNVVLMGALAFLPETRIAALAALITAVGMVGFGVKGDNWWLMLLFTLFWGAGSHLIMPIRSSLTMGFGGQTKRGRWLGQVGAVGIVGFIVGAGIVWFVFDYVGQRPTGELDILRIPKWQFDIAFYAAAAACIAAALFFLALKNVGSRAKRPSLVVKRKYWLYYVLNVLFGARKQVFLTFGKWTLVEIFGQRPAAFAKLSIVGSVIGIGFTPMVGRLVDRIGERTVLVVDSFVLMLVCMGYGGAKHLGLSDLGALTVVFTCYVVDHLFFAVGMARDTYMSKIADSSDDLTASLSLGISINHLIAATVPAFGSMLWKAHGYEAVFMAAGGVALLMTVFASMIRVPRSVDLEEVSP